GSRQGFGRTRKPGRFRACPWILSFTRQYTHITQNAQDALIVRVLRGLADLDPPFPVAFRNVMGHYLSRAHGTGSVLDKSVAKNKSSAGNDPTLWIYGTNIESKIYHRRYSKVLTATANNFLGCI